MNLSLSEEIMRSLYKGVFDQAEWKSAVEKLRWLTNSEQVALVLWDAKIDETQIADLCRPDKLLIDDYERNYARLDPTKQIVHKFDVGQWYLDVRDMGLDAMRQSAFYQEFMRSHGLASILCATVMQEGSLYGALSFNGGKHGPGFESSDIDLLGRITQHIQHAVMLRWQFQKLARQAQLGAFMLERFQVPVMVVDADGKIVLSNASAESWLSRTHARFTGRASVSLQIKSIAQRICDPNQPMPVAAMKSGTGTERNPCYLIGLPLGPNHPLACQWPGPVGVVVVHQASEKKAPWEELFRELFRLSPAETRLIQCLADHDSLYDAALTMGVSKETARSHLKAIFQKTGVRKQAALSRLVVQLSQLL